jgi:hypothetical protein
MEHVPDRNGNHPEAKGEHSCALGESRHRAIAERHADDEEANGVVRRVSQEVERVRLQRG